MSLGNFSLWVFSWWALLEWHFCPDPFGLTVDTNVILSPGHVIVNVTEHGNYYVSLDSNTSLTVEENLVTYSLLTCSNCGTWNTSKINVAPFVLPEVQPTDYYVLNTESTGEQTGITYDGRVENIEIPLHNTPQTSTAHQCLGLRSVLTNSDQYFVLRRNLSGLKFVHNNEKEDFISNVMGKQYGTIHKDEGSEIRGCKSKFITLLEHIPSYSSLWTTRYLLI